MQNAFKYVQNNGLTTSSAYPYTGKQVACKANSGAYKIGGQKNVAKTCAALQTAVDTEPISVSVDASNW